MPQTRTTTAALSSFLPECASDVVRQSVLVRNNVGGSGTTGGAAGGGAGGNFEEYGGVDPSLDPELAMVLRLSMSEGRVRTPNASSRQWRTLQAALAETLLQLHRRQQLVAIRGCCRRRRR